MIDGVRYNQTRFGFEWGAMTVERLMSDKKFGYVLEVRAGKNRVHIRCSPTGKTLSVREVKDGSE